MRLPAGFVFPDFLNLGLAPPAPRGAMAVAPRAALVSPFSIHSVFTRIPRGFTPLLMPQYFLPAASAIPGQYFTPNVRTRLLPNPYSDVQG